METYEHPNGTVYEVKDGDSDHRHCYVCCFIGQCDVKDCTNKFGKTGYLINIPKNKKSTTTRAEA